MTAFVDTNVLLDVLLEREPFMEDSARVWHLVERQMVHGCVSVISFTNGRYIIRKAHGRQIAEECMKIVRTVFEAIAFDVEILDLAIGTGSDDFEDVVQYFSALRAGATHLITRNVSDFPKQGIAVMTPHEFLDAYIASKSTP